MSSKIVCIGNGPVMSFTPYMAKLAHVLFLKELPVKFLTWVRRDDKTTAFDPSNIHTSVLLLAGSKNDSKFKLVCIYIIWMFKLFGSVVFSKDKYYICSRFENCFPVFIASFFRRIDYIYADRDSLFSTYNWPLYLKKVIKFVETQVARRAKIHLLPGESRRFTCFDNVVVVPNVTSEKILLTARDLFNSRDTSFRAHYPDKLIVYINGWVSPTRGKSHIVNAIRSKRLADKVRFLVAGDLDEDIKAEIFIIENATYLGRLSSEDALSYYFDSHLVISLYDPSVDINRKAEPNKWWDCVVTGTPFVTNYGIDTVCNFNGLVSYFQIDYDDEDSLKNFLLTFNFDNVNKLKDNYLVSENGFCWDIKVSNMIDKFLMHRVQ